MSRFAVVMTVLALLASIIAAPRLSAQSEFASERMPYDAFDSLPATPVEAGGGTLHVGFAPGDLQLPRASYLAWIARSARAVSIYYGRFPVASARILIVPANGRGVRGAQAFGYRGAAVRLMAGRDSTEDDLLEDWKSVHEMIHLALPDLGDRHLWLSEGLAVYIESIARVQAGDLTEAKIWREFVRDMPKGLPEPDDKGLDHTPTWGRRYWGGALFCLLADIEMRKRSGNRQGLQQAMRGILAAGGSMEEDWPVARVLEVADKAVGGSVLGQLYEAKRASPAPEDLEALWRDLGVVVSGDVVTFNQAAPLAAIRRAITEAPAP